VHPKVPGYQHLLSLNGGLLDWQDAGHFGPEPGHPWEEPNPVPADGTGVFGDRPQTEVPEYWIDFVSAGGGRNMHVNLCMAEWVFNGSAATW